MEIKQLREKAGYSQMQLAAKAGVSQTAICQYERGGMRHPCAYTLAKLARALNVSIEEVLGGIPRNQTG